MMDIWDVYHWSPGHGDRRNHQSDDGRDHLSDDVGGSPGHDDGRNHLSDDVMRDGISLGHSDMGNHLSDDVKGHPIWEVEVLLGHSNMEWIIWWW